MPLSGSLGHLGLADLLQSGLAGRSDGYLTLRRGAEQAVLYIADDGVYLVEPDSLDPADVLRAFVGRGVISESQAAGGVAGESPSARLDRLVAEGVVPEHELLEILASAAEDAVLDLLTWHEGTFRFEEKELVRKRVGLIGRIAVDAEGVLLRAAQRLDERAAIARALGLHPTLFCAVAVDAIPTLDTVDVGQVYERLNGQTPLSEIALVLGVSRFEVLKAIQALVTADATRPATVEEMGAAIQVLSDSGRWRGAREICLHWSETDPLCPAALEHLTDLIEAHGTLSEFLGVLNALGQVYLQKGDAESAVAVFRRGLERAPQDQDILNGTRMAAEICGDQRAFSSASLTLARAALDEGDAERTERLAHAVCEMVPGELEAYLLRGRALVRLGDRDGLVEAATGAAAVFGPKARRKQDRDIAAFFRDAIARVSPDQGELLRRFRILSEGGTARNTKKYALVGALLVIIAGAGVVFWPKDAAGVLEEAQLAVNTGQRERALELLTQIVEEFPDSDEAEQAFQLQTQILYPEGSTAPVGGTAPQGAPAAVPTKGRFQTFAKALGALPDADARETVSTLVSTLEQPHAENARRALFREIGPALPAAVRRLERLIRERRDVIAQVSGAVDKMGNDPVALKSYLETLAVAREGATAADLEATGELFHRIGRLEEFDLLSAAIDEYDVQAKHFSEERQSCAPHVQACERMLARIAIERAYERCTREASGALVSGRIEEADEIYAALQAQIKALEDDPNLSAVKTDVERRRLDHFVDDRRGTVTEIRRELEAARAAEREGDLEAAASVYAGLVRKHWQIRFENVFTIPLDVTSVPAGATVRVNGKPAGTTPCRVRYPWGAQTTVAVGANQYTTRTRVLQTYEGTPETTLDLRLSPKSNWSVEVGPTVEAPPLDIGGDVLALDRSGRIALYGERAGEVVWARHYRSLEGIRARPVMAGGYLVVAYVDGRVLFLDPKDGTLRSEIQTDRTTGELAMINEECGLLSVKGELITLRGVKVRETTPLGVTPTAGVLGAHDAYWVGSADGRLLRIDPVTLDIQHIDLAETEATVVGLTATKLGLLVTTGDGRVYALDAAGRERWRKSGLGDVVGKAAQAGPLTAVSDRRGRVLFFDSRTGEPRSAVELRAEPRGGLIEAGGLFVALLRDGRFWVYDPVAASVRVDTELGGRARFLPSALSGGRLAITANGYRLAVIDVPSAPR